MKKFLLLTLILSSQVFAESKTLEFDEKDEVKCHQVLKQLGCASDKGESLNCAEANKVKLPAECKLIHAAKMKNK